MLAGVLQDPISVTKDEVMEWREFMSGVMAREALFQNLGRGW
jgi:hypothetical protein